VRWLRPVVVVVNGAMLAATPINGGHYFVDVIAGIAIAVAAIAAARQIGHRLVRAGGELPAVAMPEPVAVAAMAESANALPVNVLPAQVLPVAAPHARAA
jgi:hypothetical protein